MRKIPVRETVAEAYRFTFASLEKVIGLIWLPTVILTVGSYFVLSPYLAGMANAVEAAELARLGPNLAMLFGFELVALVLMAMIGAAITREILAPLKRPLFLRVSLGAAEFRVVGAFLALYVIFVVFAVVCALIAVALGFTLSSKVLLGSLMQTGPGALGGIAVAALLIVAMVAALVYLMARLSFLVMPCAVIEGKFGIERSWQLTKGNVWRIVAVSLAVVLPVLLVVTAAEIPILGLDYFNPHLELLGDPVAQARHNAANFRLLADKLPLLIGLTFLMAPFSYGLMFSAPAFAYRALLAGEKLPE